MAYEHDPFLWLNGALGHAWLDWPALALSFLAEGWVVALLGLLLFRAKERARWLEAFVPYALALIAGGLLVQITKELWPQPRPLAYYDDALASGLVQFRVLGDRLFTGSFPSGHTTSAFSAAAFLALAYGRRWAWLFVPAALAGLSRVYVGAHFTMDVMGGAAIGVVVSCAVYAAALRSGRGTLLREARTARAGGST